MDKLSVCSACRRMVRVVDDTEVEAEFSNLLNIGEIKVMLKRTRARISQQHHQRQQQRSNSSSNSSLTSRSKWERIFSKVGIGRYRRIFSTSPLPELYTVQML